MNSARERKHGVSLNRFWYVAAAMLLLGVIEPGAAQAQVPPNIEEGLLKIGHIVDPICTSKLYRPFMPANDINSSVTPLPRRNHSSRSIVRTQSKGCGGYLYCG